MRVIRHTAESAGEEMSTPLSFRGVGAAREPGSQEHRPVRAVLVPVFIGSGPSPSGYPGMTFSCHTRTLSHARKLMPTADIGPGLRRDDGNVDAPLYPLCRSGEKKNQNGSSSVSQ